MDRKLLEEFKNSKGKVNGCHYLSCQQWHAVLAPQGSAVQSLCLLELALHSIIHIVSSDRACWSRHQTGASKNHPKICFSACPEEVIILWLQNPGKSWMSQISTSVLHYQTDHLLLTSTKGLGEDLCLEDGGCLLLATSPCRKGNQNKWNTRTSSLTLPCTGGCLPLLKARGSTLTKAILLLHLVATLQHLLPLWASCWGPQTQLTENIPQI